MFFQQPAERVAPTAWPLHSAAALAALLALAGCVSSPRRTPSPPPSPPADIAKIPDPTPRDEPRSARGNPVFYEVFGKRYFVLASAESYRERGVASWYGPGFHAASTSNGERYDMYGMTAAHKTLPLPSYVQVTNLRNSRSVVVRVNDRGPFKEGRIIDLSYSAASKLDMLREGVAFVEVRALTPQQDTLTVTPAAATAAVAPSLFVQAGAFNTAANAARLLAKLRSYDLGKSFIRQDQLSGGLLYRVRIGPIPSVTEFDRVITRLKSLGVADARLAAD